MCIPTAGPPNHPSKKRAAKVNQKKTFAIKLANFVITSHIMVGDKDGQRGTLFCGISFIKEQVSNQEKGTFYLNS